jgi:hypothetical protein
MVRSGDAIAGFCVGTGDAIAGFVSAGYGS